MSREHSPQHHCTTDGTDVTRGAGSAGAKQAEPLMFGTLFCDPRRLRYDAQLVRRAIRERWPMSAEARAERVRRMEAALAMLLACDAPTRGETAVGRAVKGLTLALSAMKQFERSGL